MTVTRISNTTPSTRAKMKRRRLRSLLATCNGLREFEASGNLRARTIISTPPKTAVGTPVGMDAAPCAPSSARSTTSANRISKAPISPVAGSKKSWRRNTVSLRESRRASTGAPRPTNAIGPASETETPVRITAHRRAKIRVDRTGIPSTIAFSSPRESTSSLRESNRQTTKAISITGRLRKKASRFS